QRELRDVIDVADHIRAGGLEQAQAPVLGRRVDALHVADLPAMLNLPAYRLIQRTVHRGQLRRRQAVQVMLDQEEPTACLISQGSPSRGVAGPGHTAHACLRAWPTGRPQASGKSRISARISLAGR